MFLYHIQWLYSIILSMLLQAKTLHYANILVSINHPKEDVLISIDGYLYFRREFSIILGAFNSDA